MTSHRQTVGASFTLRPEHIEALRAEADHRTAATGRPVAMSDIVRELLDVAFDLESVRVRPGRISGRRYPRRPRESA